MLDEQDVFVAYSKYIYLEIDIETMLQEININKNYNFSKIYLNI